MSRPPAVPRREDVDASELRDYDFVMASLQTPSPYHLHMAEAYPPAKAVMGTMYSSLCVSPPVSAGLRRLARKVNTFIPGQERHAGWTAADHELIDVTLGFEDGHRPTTMHALQALGEGVRVEALEAICYGRDDDLTHDERQIVDYIRMVIHGRVTDEAWNALETRFGDTRSVVEFTYLILHIDLCSKLGDALSSITGAPEGAFTRGEFEQMLKDVRAGTQAIPPAVYDTRFPEPEKAV
jgi:hypothetical protein